MLVEKIRIDSGGVQQGLNEASTAVKKFGGDIKATIAGAFGGAALVAAVRQTIQEIDQIQDASEELNLPVEQVQALKMAAREAQDEFEQLYGILNKIEDVRLDVIKGSNPALQSLFSKHGMSQADMAQMNSIQLGSWMLKNLNRGEMNTVLGRSATKFAKYDYAFNDIEGLTARGRANGLIKTKEELNSVSNAYAEATEMLDKQLKPILTDVIRLLGYFVSLLGKIRDFGNWAFTLQWPTLKGEHWFLKLFGMNVIGTPNKPIPASPVPKVDDSMMINSASKASLYSDSLLSVGNFLGQTQGDMNIATNILEVNKSMNEKLNKIEENTRPLLLPNNKVLNDFSCLL